MLQVIPQYHVEIQNVRTFAVPRTELESFLRVLMVNGLYNFTVKEIPKFDQNSAVQQISLPNRMVIPEDAA